MRVFEVEIARLMKEAGFGTGKGRIRLLTSYESGCAETKILSEDHIILSTKLPPAELEEVIRDYFRPK